MKITAIKRQAKKDYRVSIFIDDEFSFGLTEAQLIETGLAVGDEVSPKQIEIFKKLSKLGKLKEQAVSWAVRRPHSKREIEDYLKRKTTDETEQAELLKQLEKLDFVDDEKFSEMWVKDRRKKGMSSFVIKGELYKKGVETEIIDKQLNQTKDLEALKILVAKKKDKASYQNQKKFMTYLASKGFSYADIKEVLED